MENAPGSIPGFVSTWLSDCGHSFVTSVSLIYDMTDWGSTIIIILQKLKFWDARDT